jgi:hypothetical protein
MAGGKISIELKLALDKARAQAKDFAKEVQASFSKPSGGSGKSGTSIASDEQDKLTSAVKRTTEALRQQKQAAYEAAKAEVDRLRTAREAATRMSRVLPWMSSEQAFKFSNPEEAAARLQAASELRRQRAMGRMSNTGSGIATGIDGFSQPPVIPKKQKSQSVSGGGSGGGAMSGLMQAAAIGVGTLIGGPIGAAVAGILTKVHPVARATAAAMFILRRAVQETGRALEDARQTYVKAVGSGMGLGMQAFRGTLARVIGVSENEIFTFGDAIQKFSEKLRMSREVIKATTPELAYASMNWNVMMENVKAAFEAWVVKLTPVVNLISDLVSKFAALAIVLAQVAGAIQNVIHMLAVSLQAFAGWFGPGAGGVAGIASFIERITRRGAANGELTSQTWMHQMRASPWERMGLVVGAAGGRNYNRETAHNTMRISQQMQIFLEVMRQSGQIASPPGHPSTP